MNTVTRSAAIAALGAAAMYWLDPDAGHRRRAMLGEVLTSKAMRTRHGVRVAGRDFTNRMRGVAAQTRSHLQQAPEPNWPPAARLVAGASGIVLLLTGMRERGALGAACGAVGGLLLLRSTTNMPFDRLFGASGRRAIDIGKTLHVDAPVERVFATLSDYENFPAFMRNVRRVSLHGDGRSHWVVAGPAGTSLEWDAETTAHVPNEVLAWRTVRNSAVEHAGIIRFQREGEGTRLDIRMTYNPPAGAFGHAVAKLFGADAKTELDEDLLRLKTLLETGVPARDAAASAPDFGEARSQQPATEPGAQPGL